MADSWPGSSYSYRNMGSFCHHVFKQNVIPAITLSFLAALSQPCKFQWQIVLLLHASQRLCACAFSHVLHPLPDCGTHHSQLCLCVAAWGKGFQLILVHDCVHEVPWVWDRPIHFSFVHQRLLYLKGSPSLHAVQGAAHMSFSFIYLFSWYTLGQHLWFYLILSPSLSIWYRVFD